MTAKAVIIRSATMYEGKQGQESVVLLPERESKVPA